MLALDLFVSYVASISSASAISSGVAAVCRKTDFANFTFGRTCVFSKIAFARSLDRGLL